MSTYPVRHLALSRVHYVLVCVGFPSPSADVPIINVVHKDERPVVFYVESRQKYIRCRSMREGLCLLLYCLMTLVLILYFNLFPS